MSKEKCELCGKEGTEDNPVTFAPDPYNVEIHENYDKVWMCDQCRGDRADDI